MENQVTISQGFVDDTNQHNYGIHGLTSGELRMIIERLRESDAPGIEALGDRLLNEGIRMEFIELIIRVADFAPSKPD
jgi:hypothetical protein